jgi:hypothetical protein
MSEVEHGREPLVSDPTKANNTEQTGGGGTGTHGSSTVAGINEVENSEENMADDVGPDERPPDYYPHPLEGRQTDAVDEAQDKADDSEASS